MIGLERGDNDENMKVVAWVLFLGGPMRLGETWARADSVVLRDVLTEGSYCHKKFESIREETLGFVSTGS
jgi:hypothetical protein